MMTEQGIVRFGGTTIHYHVRRSARRRKTVDITVDGAGVQVAAPPGHTRRGRAGHSAP